MNALRKTLAENAGNLRDKGVTAVWFPPASKGKQGGNDVPAGGVSVWCSV